MAEERYQIPLSPMDMTLAVLRLYCDLEDYSYDEYLDAIELEDLKLVTEEQFKKVDNAIYQLNDREYHVLRFRYGFENGIVYSYGEIGKKYDIDSARVRLILSKARRKLKHPIRKSAFPALFGMMEPVQDELVELGVSIFCYNTLKKAGINTISDILNYPKEQWAEIRLMNHFTLREIQSAMRESGYPDFSILP